jgi:hypothetical protein
MTAEKRKTDDDFMYEMLRDKRTWSGETLCLKKYPRGEEKPGVMGYAAFGIVTTTRLPLVIYLREDFVRTMTYDSIDAAIAAGWVVD